MVAETRGNVVIVEDDEGLNQAFVRVLQAAGFKVASFSTATAALHSEVTTLADCLVLDMHLGDMTGYELQRRLIEAGHTRPVIVITGHDNAVNRRQAEAIGAAAYLTKPFAGRVLVDAVSRALAPSR